MQAKAKKILTGEEAELFDAWVKSKNGVEYGFAANPKEFGWLFKAFVVQLLVWIGMLGFKTWDRITGKSDQLHRDLREMKDAVLRLESSSKHWVTDKDVDNKVKETLKFLKDHKGMF